MSDLNQLPRPAAALRKTYRMVALSTGLTGCVTFLILGLAIFLGLWLDSTLGNDRNIITLVLILLSIPLNIAALFWVVRFTTRRRKAAEAQADPQQEDADRV